MNVDRQQNINKSFNYLEYMRLICLGFVLFGFYPSAAQNFDLMDIDFELNSKAISNPLTGGFDSPQFGNLDLNDDGIKDLVVLDRKGDKLMTFINNGTNNGSESFEYKPEYESQMPDIQNWFRLVDFDGDGIEDFWAFPGDLTINLDGFAIFKGTRENGKLSYEKYTYPNKDLEVVSVDFGSGETNLSIAKTDIPAFVDVDNDGDIDILHFEPFGSRMYFYQNMSMETFNNLDSIHFRIVDNCWGRFYEAFGNEEVSLSSTPDSCSNGLLPNNGGIDSRHAGSTVLALNLDGDGDLDLILGDLNSNKLAALYNNETNGVSWIDEQDSRFPQYDVSAIMNNFLGSFYLYLNDPQKRDLLVAPNAPSSSQNVDNIWFYKNTTEDDAPIFQFEQDDFLTETTIDFGSFSSPVFVDIDQDGLQDIIVSYDGKLKESNNDTPIGLSYFKNVGTSKKPSYVLWDNDYLNFSEFNNTSNRIAPCFGDIDSDGDIDFLVSDYTGLFYFMENTAGEGQPMEFADPVYNYQDLDAGQGVKAIIFDLDEDGLNDIVIGERNTNIDGDGNSSQLSFFKNIGEAGNPMFNTDILADDNILSLGGVSLEQLDFSKQVVPAIVAQKDDFICLAIGQSGIIYTYDNIKGNIDGSWNLQESAYGGLDVGAYGTIDLADIDEDGYYEFLMGNERGGISIYNSQLRVDGISNVDDFGDQESFEIYPNPGYEFINIKTDYYDYGSIYNTQGERMIDCAKNQKQINISNLSAGLYILVINVDGKELRQNFAKI